MSSKSTASEASSASAPAAPAAPAAPSEMRLSPAMTAERAARAQQVHAPRPRHVHTTLRPGWDAPSGPADPHANALDAFASQPVSAPRTGTQRAAERQWIMIGFQPQPDGRYRLHTHTFLGDKQKKTAVQTNLSATRLLELLAMRYSAMMAALM